MSIVKMKRLRLFCMAAHREELLRQLQHLGCVQVREPTDCLEDPDWSAFIRVDDTALADTRARADALRAALELLNRYAPSKGGLFSPRPEITEGQLFDDQARREAWTLRNASSDTKRASTPSTQSRVSSPRRRPPSPPGWSWRWI